MLKICSIASGSKGNCTYISSNNSSLLVDAGLPFSAIKNGLKSIGADIADIGAIVVTHEHSDHTAGLLKAANEGIPVYVHPRAQHEIIRRTGLSDFAQVDFFDSGFNIGDITVTPFRVPHDAVYTLGYTFECCLDKISVATDIGHITDGIVNNLKGSRIILLEANHDREMLLNGTYCQALKKRIDGLKGHLSNDKSGELASLVIGKNTERIILGHLSEENNSPELSFSTVVEKLLASGIIEGQDIEVEIATQNKPTPVF